ncbi:MAG TPA: FkbM family methyltransferase [Bryobacteraceae bacterium]|nr:FkbM family methyltransferase [Bryobacteraceae bacterium]
MKVRLAIALVVLSFLVVAAGVFYPPVRLFGLVLIGRSPHCSMAQAVASEHHLRQLIDSKDRILAASRLIETDSKGFRLWETPMGRYWIPPNSDYVLPWNLSEQHNKIYGTGEKAVGRGDIVLDCGANVGVYVRESLEAGAKTIVAIEPGPENIECLRRNFPAEIASGKVIVYEKGVWDKEDLLTFYMDPKNPAGDSFVIRLQGDIEKQQMPVTTIDKLVEELKLERVDYIKMDIEGAEQKALAGGRQTIAKFHPRLALSTYHRPDDPEKIPELVRQAWSGYRIECGPCAYANGIIRPDVLFFR